MTASDDKSHVFIALDQALLNPGQLEKLRSGFAHVTQVTNREHAMAEAAALEPAATALLIGVREKIDSVVLAGLPSVTLIGSASVGVDHIDIRECSTRGVQVTYSEGVNATSVAEHTLCLILAQTKRLVESNTAVIRGTDRAGLQELPREMRGQSVGVLGAGHTGVAIIRLLAPFGVYTKVWTRRPAIHPEVQELGGRFSSLDEIFSTADIVTAHVPLTPETRGVMSAERLTSLPKGAIIVNVSRGGLFEDNCLQRVHEVRPDLRFAIDDIGLLPAGVVDVLHESAIFTPHVAGVTQEASRALIDHAIEQLVKLRTRH